MSNKDVRLLFRFLKEMGAYNEYISEVNRRFKIMNVKDSIVKMLKIKSPFPLSTSLTAMIPFAESTMGELFWIELNRKFLDYVITVKYHNGNACEFFQKIS